jgi:hypothetical protein
LSQEYIRDADKSLKGLLRHLMDTQMFPYLIQQRMEESYFPLVFFDQAVKALKELGLTAVSGDRRSTYQNLVGKPSATSFESDTDILLYDHVLRLTDKEATFSLPKKPILITTEDDFLKRRPDLLLPTHFGSTDSSDGDKAQLFLLSRKELGNQRDHQLDDKSKGPLIIPGPLRQEGDYDDDLDEDERPSIVKFRYETGWPTLDGKLLDSVERDLHSKGLCALKETRARMVVQTDTRCALFIRPPNYRLSYHTSQSLLRSIPLQTTAESKGSIATVMDILSVSIMMLCIRAVDCKCPVGSILQLFSIVSHMDKAKILNFLDETSWRSMLVACGAIDVHDFGHKAMCVLFETMKSSEKVTDALAYSQYCQSFTRKLRKTSNQPDSCLDPFCHLEQLGLSWFSQKSIRLEGTTSPSEMALSNADSVDPHTPVKKVQSTQLTPPPPPEGIFPHTHSPSTPSSGGNIWRMFKGSMRNVSVAEAAAPVIDDFSEKAVTATGDLAMVLKLDTPREPYSLIKPTNMSVGMISKLVPSESIPPVFELSEAHIEERSKVLRERYAKMHAPVVIPLAVEASHDSLDDHTSARGKLIVGAIAIHGLPKKNVHSQPIKIKNVYSRVWLSSDGEVRLKTQPDITVVDSAKAGESVTTLGRENLTFYVPESENAHFHVHFEVFGDFLRDNEEICYAFDQSLGAGEAKFHQETKSTWVKLSSATASSHPELYISIHYEKGVVPEDVSAANTPKKSISVSDLDANRSSTGGGKSWRDRFSNVFSKDKGRTSSFGSTRSMTPPPPDHSHAVPPPYELHAPATAPVEETIPPAAEETKPVEPAPAVDDNSTVIESFHEANTGASNPVQVFDNAPEKKSSKWRNSLAMLTGEDVSELDTGGSPGMAQRLRRRLSGNADGRQADSGDDMSNDSADRCDRGNESPAPVTSTPPKPSMKAAFRRLSGEVGGSFMRGGKKAARGADPLSCDPLSEVAPADLVSSDPVSADPVDNADEQKGFQHGTAVEEPKEDICASPEHDASDEKQTSQHDTGEVSPGGLSPANSDLHEGDKESQLRTSLVDLLAERTSVGVHPLCFDEPTENAAEEQEEEAPEAEAEADVVASDFAALTVDTANIALPIDTEEGDETKEPAAGEEAEEEEAVDEELVDRIKAVGVEFTNETTSTRSVVGMFSETPCASCGFLMFDDEMVATWGGFCDNSLNKDGDIVGAHVILCPICKKPLIPTLHVRKYECTEGEESIHTKWQCNVQYLSAYGLRYVMEHLLAEYGFKIANASWLLENCPMAYWNLMWHCTRLNAPSGLFFLNGDSSPSDVSPDVSPWLGPVLVNWREHTLQARARKLIAGGGADSPLELVDIFPGISEEDCEAVRTVMREVDDSIPGVAKALTGLSDVKSLLTHVSGSQGRKIYMVVLMAIHFFKPVDLIASSQDLPAELSKVRNVIEHYKLYYV